MQISNVNKKKKKTIMFRYYFCCRKDCRIVAPTVSQFTLINRHLFNLIGKLYRSRDTDKHIVGTIASASKIFLITKKEKIAKRLT